MSGLRLLLVEDSRLDVEIERLELRRAGLEFEHRVVDTPEGLVAALEEFRPDLVLSDYSLPTFDGMAALRLVQQHAPDTPVVMVTGSMNEEIAVGCMKAGAADYILKDRLSRIGPAVERALAEARTRKEKARVEAALREAETRERRRAAELFAVLTAIPNPVWIAHDPAGRRITGNAAANAVMGARPEENVSLTPAPGALPPRHVIVQDGVALTPDELPIQRAARGEEIRNHVHDVLFPDGRRVRLLLNATPLRDEAGQVRGAVAAAADITEHEEAREELRHQKELLQAIVDHAPLAVVLMGPEGRLRLVNLEFERLTTLPPGVIVEHAAAALVPDPGERARLLRQIRAADGRWRDATLVGREGTPVVLSWCAVPLPGELVLTIGQDVTDQRQAELQLQMLGQAVDQSPVTLVITDAGHRVVYANRSFCTMTGRSLDELRGEDVRSIQAAQADAEPFRQMWRELEETGTWRGELCNQRPDGSPYWVELSITPVRSADGRVTNYMALGEDVTARKEAALALERTRTQLAQAQKMEAIGRLAGGVAHDFNNMLGIIQGHAELLLRDLPPDHPGRARLEEIGKAAGRSAGLARQLLAFSRKQTFELQPVQLGAVVHEAESLLRQIIGEDILMSVVVEPGLPPVSADPVQIEQVLLNLAGNARDAMPAGGRLRIEVTGGGRGPAGAGQVVLTVSDTGVGMDEGTLAHVFEPFFTTKEVGRGTGLGLATVYGIVAQLGGEVSVASAPGAGTTFRVSLPALAAAGDGVAAKAAAAPAEAIEGHSGTVLLVEDEDGLRSLMEDLVVSLGFDVLPASRADEAIEIARRHRGRIDVLLTDLVMPGRNGRELASLLRAMRPDVAVVMMSGYASDVLPGGRDYSPDERLLHKPFTRAQLSAALRDVLCARRESGSRPA